MQGSHHAAAAADRLELVEIALPLAAPFATATGSIAERRSVLVGIGDDRHTGWGEAAPYPGISPDTVEIVWGSLLADAAAVLGGGTPGSLAPSARAAVDQARHDLAARRAGAPLWRHLGGSADEVTASPAIGIPVAGIDELVAEVAAVIAAGYRAVKLKVRPGWDVAPVRAVIATFPDLAVGTDGNGSYEDADDPGLVEIATRVEYVEQPFPPADLAAARRLRSGGARLVADEAIDSPDSARLVLEAGAADMVAVKPGRLGITGSLEVLALARTFGAGVKASSLLESGVGRAHTLAIATLPDVSAVDLAASDRYFAADPWADLVRVSAGTAVPPPGPGTGARVQASQGVRTAVLHRRGPVG